MTSNAVPSSLLIRFFQDATLAMTEYEPSSSLSTTVATPVPCRSSILSQRRQDLLRIQRSCLGRVVTEYAEHNVTVGQVETVLKTMGSSSSSCSSTLYDDDGSVKEAMATMNEAARLAFCRLVLYDAVRQCQWDDSSFSTLPRQRRGTSATAALQNHGSELSSPPMTRDDVVEYAGLLNGAVRLPNVQAYLRNGTKLYDDDDDHNVDETATTTTTTSSFVVLVTKRLERIQGLLLRVIGFDIDHGKKELARYYREALREDLPQKHDTELTQLLTQLSSNMTVALTNALPQQQHGFPDNMSPTTTDALLSVNANTDDGVTRVVSVRYSERILSSDGSTQTVVGGNVAPTSESIQQQEDAEAEEHSSNDHEGTQLAQLQMARQAASLEQCILRELEEMSEVDRSAKLEEAKRANDAFVEQAMDLPAGPERITFLTSVDPCTQRLLLIHKLWAKKDLENT